MNQTKKISGFLLLTVCLSACEKTHVGAGAGAGGGALAGLALGSFSNDPAVKWIAAIAGGAIGAFAGGAVGKYLTKKDQEKAQAAAVQAANMQSNQPVQWFNPESGHTGMAIPGQTFMAYAPQSTSPVRWRSVKTVVKGEGKEQFVVNQWYYYYQGEWRLSLEGPKGVNQLPSDAPQRLQQQHMAPQYQQPYAPYPQQQNYYAPQPYQPQYTGPNAYQQTYPHQAYQQPQYQPQYTAPQPYGPVYR